LQENKGWKENKQLLFLMGEKEIRFVGGLK